MAGGTVFILGEKKKKKKKVWPSLGVFSTQNKLKIMWQIAA